MRTKNRLEFMNKQEVVLDVREDIRAGREPFSRILAAAEGVGSGGVLRLIAPFQPVPLFGVLRQKGFAHREQPMASGDWEVIFTRSGEGAATEAARLPAATEPGATGPRVCGGTPVLDVDARGLEPPQPLEKILEALGRLPEGVRLRARTDRRPMHLFARVEERGYKWTSEEQSDGSFVTYVQRA
jgi:uncharacterized protein (DUF2249 family)